MKYLALILALTACDQRPVAPGDAGVSSIDSGQQPSDAGALDAQMSQDATPARSDAAALPNDAGAPSGDAGMPADCATLMQTLWYEGQSARGCTSNEECGKPIPGTSCGCTRNWVARLDADLTWFNLLLARSYELECDSPFTTTCDCPRADGYICTGMCQWNYTQ